MHARTQRALGLFGVQPVRGADRDQVEVLPLIELGVVRVGGGDVVLEARLLQAFGVPGGDRNHPHAGQVLVSLNVAAAKAEADYGCT